MSEGMIVAVGILTLVGLFIVATATVLIVRAVMAVTAEGHKPSADVLEAVAEIVWALRGKGRSTRKARRGHAEAGRHRGGARR